MPSESLSDIKQRDWIRACGKLGLHIDTSRGKGSHILVKHPQNGTSFTIQNDLFKVANIKISNKLKQWGFTEDQIYEALR